MKDCPMVFVLDSQNDKHLWAGSIHTLLTSHYGPSSIVTLGCETPNELKEEVEHCLQQKKDIPKAIFIAGVTADDADSLNLNLRVIQAMTTPSIPIFVASQMKISQNGLSNIYSFTLGKSLVPFWKKFEDLTGIKPQREI